MNVESEQPIPAPVAVGQASRSRRAWAIARGAPIIGCFRSVLFPFAASSFWLGIFIDPRKNDGAQRMLCRVTMKLAGAKLVVRRAPGLDPARACFLLINHVNLFQIRFVLYAAVPQFFLRTRAAYGPGGDYGQGG